jgi:hypothetical protein
MKRTMGAWLLLAAIIGCENSKQRAGDSPPLGVIKQPLWVEQQKLLASDGAPDDYFGYSVSISGESAVIGAYWDDDKGYSSGSAYIFVRNGITWTQQQKLVASDGVEADSFGTSVSISGETAVIAADRDDDNGFNSGSAYVFIRNGTSWTEQQKLVASDGAQDADFGNSVSIGGDTIIIGAPGDDDVGDYTGSAYVFVRSGTNWTEQQKLLASDIAPDHIFGNSVSISGETAVIGAIGDDNNGDTSGSAYVFVRSGTSWTEQQKLLASDGTEDDRFGVSVSISGETAVIGADGDDDNGNLSGSAYVFVRSGTSWTEQQKLLASDGTESDVFGNSVSISGDTAVIGAYSDFRDSHRGSAYVFVRSGETWLEHQKLLANDGSGYRFGYSVAVNGPTTVIGATGDQDKGSYAGAAYVFILEPPKENGASCSINAECESNFCVDDVCCDTACDSLCSTCLAANKVSGADGVCGSVRDGIDPRSDCTDQGAASCDQDGQCNGSGGCRLYAQGTSCGSTSCSDNSVIGQSCNGSGECVDNPSGTPCDPYVCSAGACATPCSGDTDCVSGYFCSSGTCTLKLANGYSCGAASHCQSNQCVQGVCCNTACSGTCLTCLSAQKASGPDGTCGYVRDGIDPRSSCPNDGAASCDRDGQCDGQGACRLYAQGVSCGSTTCSGNRVTGQICNGTGDCVTESGGTDCAPYICQSGACNNPCSNNSHCLSGFFCDSGTCRAEQGNGASCNAGEQCASNYCVEGVCCDSACNSTCVSCLQANKAFGADGVCGSVRDGIDPRAHCPDDGAASCDRDGQCNGSGGCRLYAQGTACGDTACNNNLVTGQSCNGSGDCVNDPGGVDCDPYICENGSCANPCTNDDQCLTGNFCDQGTCKAKQARGSSCSKDSACVSEYCSEGVCCDSACDGTCQSCLQALKASGADGECGDIRDGIDPYAECPDDGASSCQRDGQCDGAGGCRIYAQGVSCGSTSCSDNLVSGQICDGDGSCVSSSGTDCAPYLCQVGACTNPCVNDDDCIEDHFCDQGTCKQKLENGATCSADQQCSSGYCVQSICCDSACDGICRSCLRADKTVGDNGFCGNVKDGIDPRGSCPDDGAASCDNDGQCDGQGACRIYALGVSCGETSCSDNLVQGAICDGEGECIAESSGVDCAPYLCLDGACTNPCTEDEECQSGAFCDFGTCKAKLPGGANCERYSECESDICQEGICAAVVVDAGADAGAQDADTEDAGDDASSDAGDAGIDAADAGHLDSGTGGSDGSGGVGGSAAAGNGGDASGGAGGTDEQKDDGGATAENDAGATEEDKPKRKSYYSCQVQSLGGKGEPLGWLIAVVVVLAWRRSYQY